MTGKNPMRRGGFTLIELLVAVTLMVFLMTIVVQIFLTSTDVFNRAKAKTEIYQNARYALDRMGKEINNCLSVELGNQDFRVGAPRASNAPYWFGAGTSFTSTDDIDGFPVSAPYLVMITSTSWIDSTGKQVVGSAKVVYRVKKNPVPDTKRSVTCTLQRVLYKPDGAAGISAGDRLTDSSGTKVANLDYCQFIFFDRSDTAHVDFQFFVSDPAGGSFPDKKYYQVPAGLLKTFKTGNAAPFDALPSSVRVVLDVIDEKDREIRTLSRQFLIYAAKLK